MRHGMVRRRWRLAVRRATERGRAGGMTGGGRDPVHRRVICALGTHRRRRDGRRSRGSLACAASAAAVTANERRAAE